MKHFFKISNFSKYFYQHTSYGVVDMDSAVPATKGKGDFFDARFNSYKNCYPLTSMEADMLINKICESDEALDEMIHLETLLHENYKHFLL